MNVLVIIVSYNFEKWIGRCLGSLRASTYPVSVLVIDNGSQDNTISVIENNYPEVRLIRNRANLGFGKANNIGMGIAVRENFDAVFLLNQDAWIGPTVIETLIDCCKENPSCGILSPVHLTGKGDRPDHGFSVYSGISSIDRIPENREVLPASFVNAAFWLIPVHVLKTVGGFSPLFYHYGEDKDYVNRLNYHGYSVGISPCVFGYHDREDRPATPDRFFRSEYVYLLSEYANINYSFVKAFGYGVLAGIKKMYQSLLAGRRSDAGTYLSLSLKLLRHTPEVVRTRKETRCKKNNYIAS